MASADSLLVFTALNNEPPDADYATLDTILTTSADEPDDIVPVLDFDPGATNELASFGAFMPSQYAGTTGLTVTLVWCSEATTGNVKWDVAFKSYTDNVDSLVGKAYAAVQSTTVATAGTARVVSYDSITFTDGAQIDSITAGEYFRMAVTRDSADAADTMNANDAELIAVYIKET